MTRETKIGLLVGLAFIIMIGILLSEHVTSTSEAPQAVISQVGPNVRQGVAVPGAINPTPPIVLTNGTPVTPAQPVPTNNDLNRPNVSVGVGPAGNPQPNGPITIGPGNQPNNTITTNTPPMGNTPPAGNTPNPGNTPVANNNSNRTLDDIARGHGEELGADPLGRVFPAGTQVKEYKAESGDTLSKLAGRFMGKNTKTNRDAIVAANASLKGDPNKIVVGKVYVIPLPKTVANTPTTAPSTPVNPVGPRPTDTVAGARIPTQTIWYTVKAGDTLWKISNGNASAVASIKELNKDVLKGTEKLQINMKLRLPSKAVAHAEM